MNVYICLTMVKLIGSVVGTGVIAETKNWKNQMNSWVCAVNWTWITWSAQQNLGRSTIETPTIRLRTILTIMSFICSTMVLDDSHFFGLEFVSMTTCIYFFDLILVDCFYFTRIQKNNSIALFSCFIYLMTFLYSLSFWFMNDGQHFAYEWGVKIQNPPLSMKSWLNA